MNSSITTMREDLIHKLGLGTVQFGLDYGISNRAGQTSEEEVKNIINYAHEAGIKTIDTAHLYGNSEQALGESIPPEYEFEIITKTIPIKKSVITKNDITRVINGIEQSFERLKRNKIYGLMLHHADDLASENAPNLFAALSKYKKENKFKKIGVSVYNQSQIDLVLEKFEIDIIQIPINIFDQRLIKSRSLKALRDAGVEIHARSAFLQGLVFLDPDNIPDKLKNIGPTLKKFHAWVKENNITPAQGALMFLVDQPEIDRIICGVNTKAQLQELTNALATMPKIDTGIFPSLAVDDISLIDPTKW